MTGVGDRLKKHREFHDLTQTELAEKLGVSKSHVSDVERGQRMVSVGRAARWAKILELREIEMVRRAIQDSLDKAGLPFRVRLVRE